MTPAATGHAGKAKRIAKELEALWADIFPEQLIEQLLLWTIGEGFCLCEVIWESKDDLWIPRLKVWHPSFIFYDISVRQYVAITQDGIVYVMENDPKWFLFTPFGAYRASEDYEVVGGEHTRVITDTKEKDGTTLVTVGAP